LFYILFFLGVLVGLICLMDAPLLGLAVSAAIGIAAAASFRDRAIETIMKADV
jgi:uncharacterized membrane protein